MSRIPRQPPQQRFRTAGVSGVKSEATLNRPLRAASGLVLLNADAIGADGSGQATLLTAIDSVGKIAWRVRIPHLAGVAVAGEPAVLADGRVRFTTFQHKSGFRSFVVRDGSVEQKIEHPWREWLGPPDFEALGVKDTNESPISIAPLVMLEDGDALVSWTAYEKSVTMRVAPDGAVRWQAEGMCAGTAGPVALCVIGERDESTCIARDLASGEERWRAEGPVHATTRDAVLTGALFLVNAATGEKQATLHVVEGTRSIVRGVMSEAGAAVTLREPRSTPRIALIDAKRQVRHVAVAQGEGPTGTVWAMDSAFLLYSVMKTADEWELVCSPFASPHERAWTIPWPRAGMRVWGRYAMTVSDEWLLVRHGAFVLGYAP